MTQVLGADKRRRVEFDSEDLELTATALRRFQEICDGYSEAEKARWNRCESLLLRIHEARRGTDDGRKEGPRLFKPGETDDDPELILTWVRKDGKDEGGRIRDTYDTFREAARAFPHEAEYLEYYDLLVFRKVTLPTAAALNFDVARVVASKVICDWLYYEARDWTGKIFGADCDCFPMDTAVKEFMDALLPWLIKHGPRCWTADEPEGMVDLEDVILEEEWSR